MPKTILIADDHQVVRVGIRMIIEEAFPQSNIYFASSYDEVKMKLMNEAFDIVLLDINMPGSIYKAMIKDLKKIRESVKICIFSGYSEEIALQYIHEGAEGYISKNASNEELIEAIKQIMHNGFYYPITLIPKLVKKDSENNPLSHLSERELQVFHLLSEGNGNLEIANFLNLEISTVSTYKKRIFKKLKIKNLIELIKIKSRIH